MENMRIKVALVDDSQIYCSAMKFLFDELDDIDFVIYNNPLDFLKEHKQEWRGFLLIDLCMPEIDGIALLEELKRRNNQMYTIVISGHDNGSISDAVKELGANEFLTKPFNANLLLEKIRTYQYS